VPTNVKIFSATVPLITALPLCNAGSPPVPVFPSSGGTFTLSGGASYTGTIISLSCAQQVVGASALIGAAQIGEGEPPGEPLSRPAWAEPRPPMPAGWPIYVYDPQPVRGCRRVCSLRGLFRCFCF
jgi:hypothetical protein